MNERTSSDTTRCWIAVWSGTHDETTSTSAAGLYSVLPCSKHRRTGVPVYLYGAYDTCTSITMLLECISTIKYDALILINTVLVLFITLVLALLIGVLRCIL